ncbi:Gfo/Idh/MocA family oxidoreductase [Polaromonas sp. P1-6]|nr:Gfo/Idh/MocA family oxidoreductase [Polaromonas sp. P1-6]
MSATRGWAGRAHIPALSMVQGYRLRALVGSSPETARLSANKFQVPMATDQLSDLLAFKDVDLVVVTVRVPGHKEIIEAAFKAGKAVFCEWPLARDLEEAEGLLALAQSMGGRCFINLQGRHSPSLHFIADLIADGYVGQVLSTSVLASGGKPWGQPVIDSGDLMYQDRSNGGTLLAIPFGHFLHAFCGLFGPMTRPQATFAIRQPEVILRSTGMPVHVTAHDQVCVNGLLPGGVVANIHYRAGVQFGTAFHWEINGTKGDLVISAETGHFQFGDIKIQGATKGGRLLEAMTIPDRYWTIQGPRAGVPYNVAIVYDRIRQDLLEGTSLAPTIEDAVALHRMLRSIELSAGPSTQAGNRPTPAKSA